MAKHQQTSDQHLSQQEEKFKKAQPADRPIKKERKRGKGSDQWVAEMKYVVGGRSTGRRRAGGGGGGEDEERVEEVSPAKKKMRRREGGIDC